MAEGAGEERIAGELAALGDSVSRSWVGYRLRERRGIAAPRVSSTSPTSMPVPTEEDLAKAVEAGTVDELLEDVQSLRRTAAAKGNVAIVAAMGRIELQAHKQQRQDRPPPPTDPNTHPDMVAAKERGRAEFQRLISQAEGT